MQKITKNIFRSQNTDTDKNQLEPIYFTDAHNLEFSGDGTFLAAKNIRGTTSVQDVINIANTEVLGVFETKYKINDVSDIKCLTIITATVSGNFKVWCYDTENDDLYEMYEEAVDSDYFTDDRIVDAVRYAENGIDILYFTDFYNEIRQLRCEIPSSYSANFLNENDLSLQKRGANGTIELDTVSTGGSLLSGTYQFAYRMVDPEKKKFTKWSSLTNPIHVYVTNSTDYISNAGIGLPTDQKITINVNPTTQELSNFPNFQLAVIENIYPLQTSATVASLLSVEDIADITGFEYKANTKVGAIPVEDIVVDLAAIETAKTLNVKLNKLFAGNIKYRSLELDNGTPSVSVGGSILVETGNNTATVHYDPNLASTRKGYFRDEVYRFGIVYYDKYGNHSAPVALDLSTVTDNQITPGLTDIRFPDRSTSSTYSILKSGDDSPQVLGLQLNGIDNHPTWAVAFEIVRVKRIKRILFQTPVIPMTSVEGIGAFSDYPSNAMISSGGFKEYPDAQPQTTSKVFVPKNLFIPEMRKISRRTTTSAFGGASKAFKGEAQYVRNPNYNYGIIFPPQTMYGGEPYVFSGNEKLKTVDFCITRLDVEDFSGTEVVTTGNHINTKISGNFYALRDGDYFFDNGWVGKVISDEDNQVVDYAFIDNLSQGITLSGEKILQYNDLQTKGINLGYEPTNQKMSVVKLTNDFSDDTSIPCGNGTRNSYLSGIPVVDGSAPLYENNPTNRFITEYSGFSENSSYVQALRIASVIRGEVGDDRYGDTNDQHEYISTGAKYSFSPSELADVESGNSLPINISVWGGDCFVGYHTFKVSDSVYSVVNQTKNSGTNESITNLLAQWDDIIFRYGSGASADSILMLPVALEKAAQFVQVFLESEYNGEVRDFDVLVKKGSISNTPILNVDSESSIKSPLTYKYNINLSKENDQKVYLSKPENFVEQNEFEARIVISDQKIYNSDTQGFDTFRVLSSFDLEESGGHITKLGVAGDNLYAIQERRTSYLPVGANQIEQTDAGILSVGTGDDIGRPIVIDTNKGSQHLRGVVEAGGVLYVPDNRNKAVYALSGQELVPISDMLNATYFRNAFSTVIPENELLGIYDSERKEYWVAGTDFCQRFNDNEMMKALNGWKGNLEFDDTLKGGVVINQNLYLIGKIGNQISVYTMYTGNYNQLFGTSVTPRLSFVVNNDSDSEKTFTNVALIATDRLASIDLTVSRENALTDQTGTVIADVPPVAGSYRLKLPRASNSERLRGQYMQATINWKTGNVTSTLSSMITKTFLTARRPF